MKFKTSTQITAKHSQSISEKGLSGHCCVAKVKSSKIETNNFEHERQEVLYFKTNYS